MISRAILEAELRDLTAQIDRCYWAFTRTAHGRLAPATVYRRKLEIERLLRERPARVLSLGGGLDSFAMLVEALRRGERPDVVVFVDVGAPGDPGEWPSTYRHIDQVVAPLLAREGIEFVRIDSTSHPVRDARSLFEWMRVRGQIPVAGDKRICTTIAKVERFEAWMHARYAGQDVEVWVGFDAAETRRVEKDPNRGTLGAAGPGRARRRNRFPLIEWGLCRCRCADVVRAAGYPVPRKSACVFCPYATKGDWQRFAVELPDLFAMVAKLEADKPPTKKNGIKLSIMGYDSRKKRGTPIASWVRTPYTARPKRCTVCGRQQATKATGCDYLEDAPQAA